MMKRLIYLTLLTFPAVLSDVSDIKWTEEDRKQLACLYNVVYHEARGEPLKGKRAVLDTVYNRVIHSQTSPCEVVKKRRQFAWVGKKKWRDTDEEFLQPVMAHPRILKSENRWFYSGETPSWAKDMKCRRIGNHNFCRSKNDAR